MKKVRLGDRVEDKITKASGIAWGITSYLHGCDRIHVMPEKLAEGKPQETYVFDEPQVSIIKEQAYQAENPEPAAKNGSKKEPGGPAYLSADKPRLKIEK